MASFYHNNNKLSKTENICILIDKSNDKEEDRCIVILVKIFNANTASFVVSQNPCLQSQYSQPTDLFVSKRENPWHSCIGYMSYNAIVVIDKENGVLSRIQEQNQNDYNLGCICHMSNVCVQAGINTVPVPLKTYSTWIFTSTFNS